MNAAARHALPLLALFAAAALLFATSPTDGDFWWYDASRHAMNGVFLHDALLNGGLADPKAFALDYYRRYPALSIGFYPPLFYALSVPFLVVFGVSHAVSQLVVSVHAAAAGCLVYALCLPRMSRLAAAGTALAAMFLPGMALWSRQVQLDVPALAWELLFVCVLLGQLRHGGSARLFATAVVAGCAVLTRVQAAFVLPVFAICLIVFDYPGRPSLLKRLAAIVLAVLIAAPAAVFVAFFTGEMRALVTANPGMPGLGSVDNWVWYARTLPGQLSWPGLLVVGVGLLLGARRWRAVNGGAVADRRDVLLIATLAVASWLMLTVVSNKVPRFNLPSVVFVLLLGAFGLASVHRRLADAVMPLLAAALVVQFGLLSPVPTVGGFDQAAKAALAATPAGRNILVSAHRDGAFIYDLRVRDDGRGVGARRADKLFVQMSIGRALGIRDRGFDAAQLLALMARENIATVVTQVGYLDDMPTVQNFERLLADRSRFAPVQRIPLIDAERSDRQELVVYRLLPAPATASAEPAVR